MAAADLVTARVSLRAVGLVHGDGDLLNEAVDRTVGPDGTVLVNVGGRDDGSWVDDRPEADQLVGAVRS